MMIVQAHPICFTFFPERLRGTIYKDTKNNTHGCSRRTNDDTKTSEQQKVLGNTDASAEFNGSRFRGRRGRGGRRHHDGENDEKEHDFEFQGFIDGMVVDTMEDQSQPRSC